MLSIMKSTLFSLTYNQLKNKNYDLKQYRIKRKQSQRFG